MAPPSNKSFATAALLLQWRAQVDAKNTLGETPLCLAVASALQHGQDIDDESCLRTTRLLLERRADVDTSSITAGESENLLAKAASSKNSMMCGLLVRYGARTGTMGDDSLMDQVTWEVPQEKQSAGSSISAETKSSLVPPAKPPVKPTDSPTLRAGGVAPDVKTNKREPSLADFAKFETMGKKDGAAVPVAKAKAAAKLDHARIGVERFSYLSEMTKSVKQNSRQSADGNSEETKGMPRATPTVLPGVRPRGTTTDEKAPPFRRQNGSTSPATTPSGYRVQGLATDSTRFLGQKRWIG
jgi:hypothetical protein